MIDEQKFELSNEKEMVIKVFEDDSMRHRVFLGGTIVFLDELYKEEQDFEFSGEYHLHDGSNHFIGIIFLDCLFHPDESQDSKRREEKQ